WLSISLNMYVPAGSTMPGTCTASGKVKIVILFHSSARAVGTNRPANSAMKMAVIAKMRILIPWLLFMSPRLALRRCHFCARPAHSGLHACCHEGTNERELLDACVSVSWAKRGEVKASSGCRHTRHPRQHDRLWSRKDPTCTEECGRCREVANVSITWRA